VQFSPLLQVPVSSEVRVHSENKERIQYEEGNNYNKQEYNLVVLACQRSIPTERLPLVSEVSANVLLI
jgi:hypothetical protein